MDDFNQIVPGELYKAKTSLIGSGIFFNESIEEGEILFFLREEKIEINGAPAVYYKYSYLQNGKVAYIIITRKKFGKYFEKIML